MSEIIHSLEPGSRVFGGSPDPLLDNIGSNFCKSDIEAVMLRTEARVMLGAIQTGLGHYVTDRRTGKRARFGVKYCGCRRIEDSDFGCGLSAVNGAGYFFGVGRCQSVWGCPVCSLVITSARAEWLRQLMNVHLDNSGSFLMLTMTVPHDRYDNLSDMWDRFARARKHLYDSRAYKRVAVDFGIVDVLHAKEVTWGEQSGWHPHTHELLALDSVDFKEVEILKVELFSLWEKALQKFNFDRPSMKAFDLRVANSAGEYISKVGWNTAREISKGNQKAAKAGRYGSFDLVMKFVVTGKWIWIRRFEEYFKAMKGRRFMDGFRKLRKMYDFPAFSAAEELLATPDAAPATEDDKRWILAEEYHDTLVENRGHAKFLKILETKGFFEAKAYVDNLIRKKGVEV